MSAQASATAPRMFHASMGVDKMKPDDLRPGSVMFLPDQAARRMAEVILSDERLTHRYCMIASGYFPDGSGRSDPEEYERVKGQLKRLAVLPVVEPVKPTTIKENET